MMENKESPRAARRRKWFELGESAFARFRPDLPRCYVCLGGGCLAIRESLPTLGMRLIGLGIQGKADFPPPTSIERVIRMEE